MATKAISWAGWIKRGALAIADQGLISGSNFLLSILLARWLGPRQYGAYALGLSIFYLVAAVHQALLLEPMSVLGASEYSAQEREYGGAILWFQFAISLVLLVVFGGAAWIAHSTGDQFLAAAMYGLTVSGPGILLFWMARIACYMKSASTIAASGAVMYSVLLLGGAWMMSRGGVLTALTALILMGAVAFVVGVGLLIKIGPSLWCSRAMLRDAARRHWKYGRWALGSSLVIWVPANLFYSIVTAILGIGATGAFRALMNLIFPVTHTCSALSLLFQPQLSRQAKDRGAAATTGPVFRMMALYAAGALGWLALVAAETDRVWSFLYHGRFQTTSGLAVLLLTGVVFQVAAYAPAVGLRALQSPSLIFLAYSVAAVTCVAGGIPATRLWGLTGAVLSYSTSLVLSFSATLILYRRRVLASGGSAKVPMLSEPLLTGGVR